MDKRKIKEVDNVIAYLKSINYYNNKTEPEVKRILLLNIQRFKDSKISIQFLAALCSELLYFNNNIGAFTDAGLRNTLLKGDKLSSMYTLGNLDLLKEESLKQSLIQYV